MFVSHTTERRNLESILKVGLLTSKSRGRRKAVWFTGSSRIAWAFRHCQGKRRCRPEELITLTVWVPDTWIQRYSRAVYYVMRDVPACNIHRVTGYAPVQISLTGKEAECK